MSPLLVAAVAADPWRWDLTLPGKRSAGVWRSVGDRAGVPGCVTLQPGAEVVGYRGELLRDSFADQAPRGFTTLLNGAWVARPPSTVPPTPAWSVSTDVVGFAEGWADPLEVPAHPRVVLLTRHAHGRLTAGAVATVHSGVVSLGSLFTAGKDLTPVWTGAADLAGVVWPGIPVVSHDSGTGLATAMAAGFRQLGPMRLLARLQG